MENILEKRLKLSGIDLRKLVTLSVAVILIVLIAALCIISGSRAHIQSEYAKARNELTELLYTELYIMCQTFDQVAIPGAEIQDVIIPSMRDHYLAAQALNEALGAGFGSQNQMLDSHTLSALEAAFTAYDDAFRTGQPTDSAQNDMNLCVTAIREVLNGYQGLAGL
ncbi:MAG: hypothetical protein U0L09_09630 [Christensenellales bacterium]|nr:hypothetical protein [Christensenellales bacterium]